LMLVWYGPIPDLGILGRVPALSRSSWLRGAQMRTTYYVDVDGSIDVQGSVRASGAFQEKQIGQNHYCGARATRSTIWLQKAASASEVKAASTSSGLLLASGSC